MLMQQLDIRKIPAVQPAIAQAQRLHVAIISDGNGRWATSRGLPRSAGHRAGAEAARRVIEAAPRLGIHTLTLFALSSANWKHAAASDCGFRSGHGMRYPYASPAGGRLLRARGDLSRGLPILQSDRALA